MPTYTKPAAPTTPTYTRSSVSGNYFFDDENVIFNDPVVQFNGGTVTYTAPSAPTSPTYTKAASPS